MTVVKVRDGREFTGPEGWSENAVYIAGSKYARVIGGRWEATVADILHRIAAGVFPYPRHIEQQDELAYLMRGQCVAFNSPVWFNLGVREDPQCPACFILSLDDSMASIVRWWETQTWIYKYGSGMGADLSRLREAGSPVGEDGQSSGPLPFARVADAIAQATKSGGITRRAATMLTMQDTHPDVLSFITAKSDAERIIKTLGRQGWDTSLNSCLYDSISHQQANRAVRLSDAFMVAALDDAIWPLTSPRTGQIYVSDAGFILDTIARCCWESGDPGVQFADTIQKWHTIPAAGPIRSSNPCSEYMSIDDSACNLASINLLKYYDAHGFRLSDLAATIRLMIQGMDRLVDISSYPTETIARNTRLYRQLGLGFTNLGGLLMTMGIPYDSERGRAVAGALMALITGYGYLTSAELAIQRPITRVPYTEVSAVNRDATYEVIGRHVRAMDTLIAHTRDGRESDQISYLLDEVALVAGKLDRLVRNRLHLFNSQISVVAPTGTISFVLDAATTGIEPAFAVAYEKELVGGGSLTVPLTTLEPALRTLGYGGHRDGWYLDQRRDLIAQQGSAVGFVEDIHLPVFATATDPRGNTISPEGHVRMVAAVQPFVSGAISKTINLPATASDIDFKDAIVLGWELGCKALTFYRDGSKGAQPLVTRSVQLCDQCGRTLVQTGTCWSCPHCGEGGICG